MQTTTTRPLFTTQDVWCAAYLHAMGLALVEVQFDAVGRTVWVFDNAGDDAYQAAREYRTAGVAMVPVQGFRNSYRSMFRAADTARRERVPHDDDHLNQ